MSRFIVRTVLLASLLVNAFTLSPALAAQAAPAAASQPQVMPASLQDAYSATVGQPFAVTGSSYRSEHNGMTYSLSTAGVQAQGSGFGWDISLRGFGRGNALQDVQSATATQNGTDLQYVRGSLTEWYRNLPFGLEQGFTIDQSPAGNGKLTLQLDLKSNVSGTFGKDGRGLSFTSADGKTLRYDQLKAYDAAGAELDAKLVYTTSKILIQVDDRNAAYPVTIDPFIYLEQKVIAPDGTAFDTFGDSVALSGDTALIGAPGADIGSHADQGATYVFVNSGGTWALAAKLTASDGATGDNFGTSVALDGGTALIGAPGFSGGTAVGAAYVFVKPAGGWLTTSSFTAELTASDGASADLFGSTVSLSADTALVGAVGRNSHQGAAYVYVKPGGGWATTSAFNAELTASDGAANAYFAYSLSISGDTALVGAYTDNGFRGAAYVFVKPGGGWATNTETAKLTASSAVGDELGFSVALSGDTALIGAPGYNAGSNVGAAYVFVKPGGGWVTTSTPDAQLQAYDGVNGDHFGSAVALSGTTALISAVAANGYAGAAYVYRKSSAGWISTNAYTARLAASDGASPHQFGFSIAISGDAALLGAPLDPLTSTFRGSAYFYQPYADYAVSAAANLTSVSPADTVYLTVSVTNYGPTYADFDLAVNAPLPNGLSYYSYSATNGSYDDQTGLWSIGTFPSGTHATLTITATVDAFPPLFLNFTASLAQSDIDNSNNSDTVILPTFSASGSERLTNGGFNTYPGVSNIPTGWIAQGFAPTDGKDAIFKMEGAAAVRMNGQAGVTKLLFEPVPVSGVAADRITLSFQVMGRSIPSSGACLALVILLNGSTTIKTSFVGCPVGSTNGFIPRTLSLTAPGPYTLAVVVFLYAKGGGTVWFDAASLIK